MGAAAGPAAAATSIAGAGLNAYATTLKGEGENAASVMRAAQLERAAEYGKLAAKETGAQLSEQLAVTLGNIDAVRAAGRADPTSPTTAAIRERTTYIAERERTTKERNLVAQAEEDEASARYLRQAGRYAISTSRVAAAGQLLSGASGAVRSMGPAPAATG